MENGVVWTSGGMVSGPFGLNQWFWMAYQSLLFNKPTQTLEALKEQSCISS